MSPRDEPTSQAAYATQAGRTYAAAADHYRRPALGFWDRWGSATVSRIDLSGGDRVLDVCCGAGASAIPAALAVGATGSVLGLDLAEPLLALARQRAADLGVGNVSFERHDATETGLPSESFDAVVCVFGVFFAADMPAFVAEMWRLVRPGGTLAITTWGPGWCEPASDVFWSVVGRHDPTLVRAFNPWDDITTPAALRDVFERGGVTDSTFDATSGEVHHLEDPADFWDVVLGSGYRATIDALPGASRDLVRRDLTTELRERGINSIGNDVVFGAAVKN